MKMYLARREQRRFQQGREATVWDQVLDWSGKLGAAGSAKLFAAIATYPHEVCNCLVLCFLSFAAATVSMASACHLLTHLRLPGSLPIAHCFFLQSNFTRHSLLHLSYVSRL